jgi:hypothetical protein
LSDQNHHPQLLLIILVLAGLLLSLACSAGRLLVQAGTATPTPLKTPRPTYTYTPLPTATFPPTPTPSPEAPTATPAPDYPFGVTYSLHDAEASEETRLTAWIKQDTGPGLFSTLAGFQVVVIAPDGNSHLSELSGSEVESSMGENTGEGHNMNTQITFSPYTPGPYRIHLVEGGVQVSPEVQLTLPESPAQYVHFEFSRTEQ